MKNDSTRCKTSKKQSDVVIVSAHRGNENHHTPNKTQKYAQLFADEGVDVVIGTHPHVIQPVKWVKSKRDNHQTLVAYSLGNFLNGQDTEMNIINY